jgi:hypothetical protein
MNNLNIVLPFSIFGLFMILLSFILLRKSIKKTSILIGIIISMVIGCNFIYTGFYFFFYDNLLLTKDLKLIFQFLIFPLLIFIPLGIGILIQLLLNLLRRTK